jgi:hypothetical protein
MHPFYVNVLVARNTVSYFVDPNSFSGEKELWQHSDHFPGMASVFLFRLA